MTLPATVSTTLAADKVLALVKLSEFTVGVTGNLAIRAWLDMGVVHVAAGTAGSASVRGAWYLIESGDPAPSSAAANSYGHENITITRDATYRSSFSLGSAILDEVVPSLAAGDWEIWGAVVVNDVGTLNGVAVDGITPSGIIDILPSTTVSVESFSPSL